MAARQAALIAQWMNVGFIHGVMNTDNMTISGETIDYGPCAFVEAYDPAAVFSSIDSRGRYAFGNQPAIAQWNLTRLAETLLPLIAEEPEDAAKQATAVIEAFPALYLRHLLAGQRAKLGLREAQGADDAADAALANDWLELLHAGRADFTLAWRRLADAAAGDEAPLRALFLDPAAPDAWLARWRERCAREDEGAAAASARRRRSARRAHAQRQSLGDPAQPSGRGSARRRLGRRRPRPVRAPARGPAPALRRDRRARPYAEPAPVEVTACYRTFCGT